MTNVVDPVIFQWKAGASPLLPSMQDWSYDYWITNLTFSDNLIHPCPRPADLCEVIIRNWTIENGIILDAFTGSGQIPLAVHRVGGGRKCVAVELVPEYAAEAEQRLIEAVHDAMLLHLLHFWRMGGSVFAKTIRMARWAKMMKNVPDGVYNTRFL